MSSSVRPQVSVVMPVYGVERYVGAAVDSVLRQSWRDFELIVVDDATADRSIEIVRTFSDPRIRIVRHERNKGLAAARNTGLDAARGEFVAMLDSDDVASPDRLDRQVRLLRAQPRLVGCGGSMRTMHGGTGKASRRYDLPADPETLRSTLLFHNTFFASALTLRTGVARSVRYRSDFAMAEDYDFSARLAAIGPLTNLPDVLLRYRIHAHSLTSTRPQKMAECVRRVCAAQLEALSLRCTPRERELHHHAGHLTEAPSLTTLADLHDWLLRLHRANGATRVYETRAFERVLSTRWFEVCTHAAPLGPEVLRQYLASPLATAWRPPALRRAKFAIKSMLRRSLRPHQPSVG